MALALWVVVSSSISLRRSLQRHKTEGREDGGMRRSLHSRGPATESAGPLHGKGGGGGGGGRGREGRGVVGKIIEHLINRKSPS